MPAGHALDLTGLDLTHAHVEDAIRVDREEWDTVLASIEEWSPSSATRYPTPCAPSSKA